MNQNKVAFMLNVLNFEVSSKYFISYRNIAIETFGFGHGSRSFLSILFKFLSLIWNDRILMAIIQSAESCRCHSILSSARKCDSWYLWNAIEQSKSKTRFKHRLLSFFNLSLWLKFVSAFRPVRLHQSVRLYQLNVVLFEFSLLFPSFLLLSHFIFCTYFFCYLMLVYSVHYKYICITCAIDVCMAHNNNNNL